MPPPTTLLRAALPYGTAVLAVGAALAAKFRLAPLMEAESPLLLFHAAVLVSAWRGGVGPGLLATVLATLAADYYFATPRHFVLLEDPGRAVRLIVFAAEGAFISALSGLRLWYSTEAHRRAEELRVTLRSIGDAVLATCPDGRVTFLNPRAEELTGWASRDAAGRPVGEVLRLVGGAAREPVACPVRKVVETGRESGPANHTLLVARDGTERPVDDSAAPIRDPDGELLGVVVVLRDVTERRQAELFRAETLRRTTAILESIRDGFYALDRDWRYTYLNAPAERYFGRPKATMLGRVVWEFYPAARGTLFDTAFHRAVADGTNVQFETRSPVTGGWVEVAAYPSQEGLAVYFRDVTDRKRGEEERERLRDELEAERTLLRAVLDQLPAGVAVAEAESGRVVVANARAELPWDAGGWAGPDGGAAPLHRLLDRARAGEVVRGAELRRTAPDGRTAWFRVSAAPARAGAAPFAVVVLDDVSAEKEAEADRWRAAERERQQLVARLTTITEDERRRISRELHDETSQLLASLIAGLKTVRDRPGLDGPAARTLEALQHQADRVGRAVHRIAWELRPAALDAVGLEAAVRSWAERWSGWSGVPADVHTALGPARLPPEVETQLYRLITEALANVSKHAAATRVGVLLERRKAVVLAAVEDDGRGFDPEAVAAPGLGLLGMRERARLLGGTLHVESAPGRGTTVLARVPVPPPQEEHR